MLIQLLVNRPELISKYESGLPNIIILQDGVYAARDLHRLYPKLKVFALMKDWQSAGLPNIQGVTLISDEQWVDKCIEAQPIITLQ